MGEGARDETGWTKVCRRSKKREGFPKPLAWRFGGGKRKISPETTGHVLKNFVTQMLPAGLDRNWLLWSPLTLRLTPSFLTWACWTCSIL